MFSEEEQGQLESFLNNLESIDTGNGSTEAAPDTLHTPEKKDSTANSSEEKHLVSKSRKSSTTDATTTTPNVNTSASTTKNSRARKRPHELLSEDQKKANHIASEQKRRANIRIGFEQLVEIVPALDGCHRSEALILQKSVDYIRGLVNDKNELKERVRQLQTVLGEVPDEDSSEGEMEYSY